MKKIMLILTLLILQTLDSAANPLLGIWNKVDGPSSVIRYNYLDDSTTILLFSDSSSMTLNYVLDTSITPHRITWLSGGQRGNLGIWSISGDILTIQGSGGDTINFPPSFTNPSHFAKQTTGVYDNPSEVPNVFSLLQNYPNPFNPSTNIQFILSHSNWVTLKIYNMLGQEISTLISANLPSGFHQIEWVAQDIPSGTYFYRLHSGSYSETKQLVLLR